MSNQEYYYRNGVYLIGVLLSVSLPLGKIPIIAILAALFVIALTAFDRKFFPTQLRKEFFLLSIPFHVYIVFSVAFFFREGLDGIEKNLLFLFLPFAMTLFCCSSLFRKDVLTAICKGFACATGLMFLLTLAAAAYNVFNKVSPTGRASDFFFHMQLSAAFVDLHPTYLALCGSCATLIVLFLLKDSISKVLLAVFLSIVVMMLMARIVVVIHIAILAIYFVSLIIQKIEVKRILIMIAIGIAATIAYLYSNKLYDYEHRSLNLDLKAAWERSSAPDVSVTDWGIVNRLATWRAALKVIQNNLWTGVGVENEYTALKEEFIKGGQQSLATENFNCHNQLLSYLVTYGLLGTLIIVLGFAYLFYVGYRNRNWLYLSFLLTFLVVSMTESVLQRAYGIAIFSFLNSTLFFIPNSPRQGK